MSKRTILPASSLWEEDTLYILVHLKSGIGLYNCLNEAEYTFQCHLSVAPRQRSPLSFPFTFPPALLVFPLYSSVKLHYRLFPPLPLLSMMSHYLSSIFSLYYNSLSLSPSLSLSLSPHPSFLSLSPWLSLALIYLHDG